VVESPLAFLEIERESVLRDAVKFAHVSFGLVPKILDAVDVIVGVRELFRMVDAQVLERRGIQDIVPAPAVAVDDTVRDDLALDDGIERRGGGIRDDLGIDLATPFKQAKHGGLVRRAPSAPALPVAAEATLIDLHFPAKHRRTLGLGLPGNDLSQTVKVEGSGVAVNAH